MEYQTYWLYIQSWALNFMRLKQLKEEYQSFNNIELTNLNNMDLLQRYTKDEFFYKMEEDFTDLLRDLPEPIMFEVVNFIERELAKVFVTQKFTSGKIKLGKIKGVIRKKNPIFISVHYLNYDNLYPVCYNLDFIECDEYLDYLNTINKSKSEFKSDKRVSV